LYKAIREEQRMNKTGLVITGFCLLLASQMSAATVSELTIDAGGGTTADLTVDQIGFVTCSGACGGLTFASAIIPHDTLNVTGTIGRFNLTTLAGVGGLGVIPPALLNLTQNDATSRGAGTLTISYSDTDYGIGGGNAWGSQFNISVQSNPDFAIVDSTVTGLALADAANTLGGGSIIDGPFTILGVNSHVATVPNNVGSTGSLTAITQLNFSGSGHIQSTFTISSSGVPEPGTVSLLGLGAGVFALKLRGKRRIS
jgi:PEP-CTERM motif